MTLINQLWIVAKVGYVRRVSGYRFLVILLLLFAWTLLIVPPVDSQYFVLDLGGYRGFYNSTWIASLIVILSGEYLSLLLFYTVNDSLKFDLRHHMGPIIASSSMTNLTYLAGKFLGNVLVLMTFLVVMVLYVPFVQVMRGESYTIDLLQTILPFVVYLLPAP